MNLTGGELPKQSRAQQNVLSAAKGWNLTPAKTRDNVRQTSTTVLCI
jgi:hypothetical protein